MIANEGMEFNTFLKYIVHEHVLLTNYTSYW